MIEDNKEKMSEKELSEREMDLAYRKWLENNHGKVSIENQLVEKAKPSIYDQLKNPTRWVPPIYEDLAAKPLETKTSRRQVKRRPSYTNLLGEIMEDKDFTEVEKANLDDLIIEDFEVVVNNNDPLTGFYKPSLEGVVAEVKKSKKEDSATLLNKVFTTVWESINASDYPFDVLTNIQYYRDSVFDDEFINKFIAGLKENVLIIPIKVVNIKNLNVKSLNVSVSNIERSIRDADLGFRCYGHIYLPSLNTTDNPSQWYDKDYVLLEISDNNPFYKNFKKEILDRFKELDLEIEQVGDSLAKLVKANPEYHKLVYERNKIKVSLDISKQRFKDLERKIYKFESGVISTSQIDAKDNNYKRAKLKVFSNLLFVGSKDTAVKEDKKYTGVSGGDNAFKPIGIIGDWLTLVSGEQLLIEALDSQDIIDLYSENEIGSMTYIILRNTHFPDLPDVGTIHRKI